MTAYLNPCEPGPGSDSGASPRNLTPGPSPVWSRQAKRDTQDDSSVQRRETGSDFVMRKDLPCSVMTLSC